MLYDSFSRILSEYLQESKKDLVGNSLASFIRTEVPSFITNLLENPERYKVVGSSGQGNWASCPWIAVFDRLVTETAQSGYYPVYLFREDMSGLYLSLNQGVTEVKEKYKSKAKQALRSRAKDYLSQIGGSQEHFPLIEIDLRTSSSSNLAAFYEAGNICACFYGANNILTEEELKRDFREMLKIYEVLSYNETVPVSTSEREEDEGANLLIEDLRKLRQHKRIDRNSKLAREAKKIHGTTCKACGFNFEATYGELGSGFIEAHHLQPLSNLKNERILLSPRDDFTVLCANCHRMIHRYDRPHAIVEFRNEVLESG